MRHIYAYRVTYIIALLIVLVAMLFAWLRSLDVPPEEHAGMGHHPLDVVWVASYQPAAAVTLDMQRIQRYYPFGMTGLSPRTLAHGAGLAGRFRLLAALAAGPRDPVPRERSAD